MTRRSKKILFLFFLILFLAAAPLAIFYSFGWRIDFRGAKIIRPGIIYFKVLPKSCQIYVNGKAQKKTDFLFGSATVENLVAGRYSIEIKKDGFQTWQKNLDVAAASLTELKDVVLFPDKLDLKILSKDVELFFLSPDGKKIFTWEKNAPDPKNPGDAAIRSLKLIDAGKNIKSQLIEEKDFKKAAVRLLDLKPSPDSKILLLKAIVSAKRPGSAKLEEATEYYALKLEQSPILISLLPFSKRTITKIDFDPAKSQQLLFLDDKGLNRINLADNGEESLLPKIVSFAVSGNNIYYLEESGGLFKTDSSFGPRDRINDENLQIQKDSQYEIFPAPSHIALKEGRTLYLLQNQKRIFERISDSAEDLVFSPDSKKAAYLSEREVNVLFLEDDNIQPRKKAGESLFITRFSERINGIFWLTNRYLLLDAGGKIKAAEIDDRDKINIFDLAETPDSKNLWNPTDRKIYSLREENLSSSQKVTP